MINTGTTRLINSIFTYTLLYSFQFFKLYLFMCHCEMCEIKILYHTDIQGLLQYTDIQGLLD